LGFVLFPGIGGLQRGPTRRCACNDPCGVRDHCEQGTAIAAPRGACVRNKQVAQARPL